MGLVHLSELKPGMVLARDLLGANGRMLLSAGNVLKEKHIRIAKIWGVFEADIQDMDQAEARAEAEANLDPTLLHTSRSLAGRLFALANTEHPAMAELLRLTVMKTARELSAGIEPESIQEPEPSLPGTGEPDRDELPMPGIEELVEREQDLASFPDIYHEIVEVLNNPRSSAMLTAEVVSKDPGLSARLLRLVNSPLYGFPGAIDSVVRAVALVGSNELSMLALGLSLTHYFKDIPQSDLDMRTFWRHSVACGVYARLLAGRKSGLSEERAFLAGLLHDIGQLVLARTHPRGMARALAMARETPCLTHEAEQEVMGFDHPEVAGLLLAKWNLPPSLVEMAAGHHDPESCRSPAEAAIVHLADILSFALKTGYRKVFHVPPLSEAAWRLLDISPAVLAQIVAQGERLTEDIFQAFMEPLGQNGQGE